MTDSPLCPKSAQLWLFMAAVVLMHSTGCGSGGDGGSVVSSSTPKRVLDVPTKAPTKKP